MVNCKHWIIPLIYRRFSGYSQVYRPQWVADCRGCLWYTPQQWCVGSLRESLLPHRPDTRELRCAPPPSTTTNNEWCVFCHEYEAINAYLEMMRCHAEPSWLPQTFSSESLHRIRDTTMGQYYVTIANWWLHGAFKILSGANGLQRHDFYSFKCSWTFTLRNNNVIFQEWISLQAKITMFSQFITVKFPRSRI